jgi:hypothetical protein
MRKLLFAGLAAAMAVSGSAVATGAGAQTIVVHERYGHWDPAWGVVPPPPLHSWHHWRGERARGWYSHVHNCMVKYKTYDPHRDMYMIERRWVPCNDVD